jgi:hypothetical protein
VLLLYLAFVDEKGSSGYLCRQGILVPYLLVFGPLVGDFRELTFLDIICFVANIKLFLFLNLLSF